ncbi:MAG: cache domain-containing protein [Arcobacter sp.]|uniref:cache domain-containing protein n=1 Tax=Arcobacter sp. TaxID=1872629 RepID=UPI003D0590AE
MKLSKFIKRFIFITAFVSSSLAFLVSMLYQYNNFQNDIIYIKNEFTEQKKKEIKEEVLTIHKFIQYKEELLNDSIHKRLEERVNQAYTIAKSIYDENKDTKSDDEIKYLIANSLKNLTYPNDNSYFFINSNKGRAVLFNKEIKLDNYTDVWNLKDYNEDFIIQKQAKVALEKKEGLLVNNFVKPDTTDKKQYSKISYVKLFEPFDWHIGIGEYVDEIREKNKDDLLDWIATIRFGNNGYIFVNSMDGKSLVFDGKRVKEPKEHPFPDLFQKQLDTIKNPEGGYFSYKFKKPNTSEEYDKISFIKKYEAYNWIIGTGIYLDDMQMELNRKEAIFKQTVINQIKSILVIFVVLLIVIYFLSEKLSNYINSNINNLILSFKKASKNNEKINTNDLTYQEFITLANNLNTTLENKNLAEKRLQDYIQIVNENVIISSTNKDGVITDVSEAFCEISGYSRKELIGKTHNLVRHPDVPNEFYENMWNTLLSGKSWKGEIHNINKKGEEYWVWAIIKPVIKNNEIKGFTAIRSNITDKKHIEHLSITDELTRLYNRRFFNTKINEEINRAKRENNCISLLILDIDYFKQYNDTYGHQKGDVALEDVARLLKNKTNRASDFAFRLGGEEFAIITTLEKEKAIEFAQILRTEVENLKIEHKASDISKHLTISIGLVSKNANEVENSDKLYKEADDNLYEAKKQGRNTVFFDNKI